MLTLRDYAVIVGVVLFSLGACCIPVGIGASPKRNLSAFNNLADLGAFFSVGLVLIALGLSVVLLAFLIPYLVAKVRRLTRRSSERRGGVGPF